MKIKLTNFVRIQRLHLFSDGTETYAAYDLADAVEVWKELVNEKERDGFYDPFELIPDRETITICCEREDFQDFKRHRPLFSKVDDRQGQNYPSISAPAWAWALQNGRGFFSSTEW